MPFPTSILLNSVAAQVEAARAQLNWQRPIRILSSRNVQKFLCNPWTLVICKVLIGIVSAYDVYLTIKYFESLPEMEVNPIGRWMMQLDSGPECQLNQIAGFIAGKFAGNFIALAVIELLVRWKESAATLVAVNLAAFQLILLYHLLFGFAH